MLAVNAKVVSRPRRSTGASLDFLIAIRRCLLLSPSTIVQVLTFAAVKSRVMVGARDLRIVVPGGSWIARAALIAHGLVEPKMATETLLYPMQ